MNSSKIQLSAEEMQLVTSSGWILTKHRVIEKVYLLLGELSGRMQEYLEQNKAVLPAKLLQLSPKIAKGEQYKQLPYVVLDYPRVFSKEDVFAVRCFFWWGNYFSITLHLKGIFQQAYGHKIITALADRHLPGYYISFEGNEFSFNLAGKNYAPLSNGLLEEYKTGDPCFLKISYQVPLADWPVAGEKLLEVFKRYLNLVID